MKYYRCDRCNERIESDSLLVTVSLEREHIYADMRIDDHLDLCVNCYEKFKKWLRREVNNES